MGKKGLKAKVILISIITICVFGGTACGKKESAVSKELTEKYETFVNNHDIEAVCRIAVNNLMAEELTELLLYGEPSAGEYLYSVNLYDTDMLSASLTKKDVETPPAGGAIELGFTKYFQVLSDDRLIPLSFGIDEEHVTLKEGALSVPEADNISFENFYNKTSIVRKLRTFLYERYMIHNPKDQSNWPVYYITDRSETKEIRLLDLMEDQLEFKAMVITDNECKYLLDISTSESGFEVRGDEVPISDAQAETIQPVFEANSAVILKKHQDTYENITTTFYEDVTLNSPMGDTSTLTDLGDLNGNGQTETIISDIYPWTDGFEWTFYVDDKNVYNARNDCYPDFYASYIDLDEDGSEEIVILIYPHVNSDALAQYVVLKNTDGGLIELENTEQWSNNLNPNYVSNHFPVDVRYGKEKNTFEITLEGCDTIITDVTKHYQKILDSYENSDDKDSNELYRNAKEVLVLEKYSAGDDVGGCGGWGIENLDIGEYNGKNCIVAGNHVLGPLGNWDAIGWLNIYFNYDKNGKIQVLGVEYKAYD